MVVLEKVPRLGTSTSKEFRGARTARVLMDHVDQAKPDVDVQVRFQAVGEFGQGWVDVPGPPVRFDAGMAYPNEDGSSPSWVCSVPVAAFPGRKLRALVSVSPKIPLGLEVL